jgi:SAM-dependent methyltransferase
VSAGDPLALLRGLYRGVDGFAIPADDARVVSRSRGSPTYGELMPTATLRLLQHLQLGRDDVLYDLGAGVGKLVLLAALTTPARRVVGVELSRRRVDAGAQALAAARRARLPGATRATLRHGDMLKIDLGDATVIYTCSTAFSTAFMGRLTRRLAKLPRLHTFVSLQDLDPHPAFVETETLRLDASWRRRTNVHVYVRVRD